MLNFILFFYFIYFYIKYHYILSLQMLVFKLSQPKLILNHIHNLNPVQFPSIVVTGLIWFYSNILVGIQISLHLIEKKIFSLCLLRTIKDILILSEILDHLEMFVSNIFCLPSAPSCWLILSHLLTENISSVITKKAFIHYTLRSQNISSIYKKWLFVSCPETYLWPLLVSTVWNVINDT